ncbi:DUF3656 domain-containing protein [Lachnospiraceae bacterium 45-W7]
MAQLLAADMFLCGAYYFYKRKNEGGSEERMLGHPSELTEKGGTKGLNSKIELLAPAGSYEILTAVIHAGADAVYAAGARFGARAYADNFTEEELLKAIDFVHIKGRKLYLTVNTLLKQQEIGELYEYLCPLYEAGLDAVIVQDLGVMRFVKKHFPDLAIHASTQMTVTGAYGAKLLLEQGCSRIVTARELSLQEISNIYQTTGAEIESFVHGALCYGYSGQCLLSSMIGGRSGNRGRCAQPCRLSYELFEHRSTALAAAKQWEYYPLSLKDLCTIHLLPELAACGIHSFKIEGRMKQAVYAAGVTSIYRKYIDLFEAQEPYQVSGKDEQTLQELGSRCGFTEGYYRKHDGRDMITFEKPSHEKKNEVLQKQIQSRYVQTENKEKIKGILRLFPGKAASLVLQYKEAQTEVTGDIVQPAEKQPLSRETVLEKMKKTGNTPFELEHLELELGAQSFLPVGALNQLRRAGLEKLIETATEKYKRSSPVPPRPISVECAADQDKNSSLPLRLSVLTETLEQFYTVLQQPEADRIYLEAFVLDRKQRFSELRALIVQAHNAGKECYLAMPYLFRLQSARWYEQNWEQIKQAGVDGYLVRNLEELSFLKEREGNLSCIQGDYNLYCYSNEAVQALADLSLRQYTLPAELNFRELKELDGCGGEMLLYGYQPLMLSAQCLPKNTAECDREKGIFYLKDRYGKLFPVKNRCEDCYNIIYNISPLALFHQWKKIETLSPAGVRMSFTLENRQEVVQIFRYFRQAKDGKLDREKYLQNFTNGHFKRGVE